MEHRNKEQDAKAHEAAVNGCLLLLLLIGSAVMVMGAITLLIWVVRVMYGWAVGA